LHYLLSKVYKRKYEENSEFFPLLTSG
jgi:hypothetical protein